ncbi:flagellin [Polynucleobacter sp. MWH-HuK1]|uniref:flagellin N-terminal helical domain-containing protein n=1 Tax=Polynucleobacter sp. MWH-HuK1 TaxID=1743158 RepID=UPI002103DB12|nr:flagellin [Polynucleobacter sp. MWH-HuK1]
MSVRFSSNQVVDAGVQGMDNALADAMSWNQKVTSGKQYSKASDNAYAVSRGVRLDFDISRLEMFKTNQNFVMSSHANAQTQMDSMINEMNSLKQLFVQSQSGALNKSNFAALKVQAEQIRDTIKTQMTARDATGNPIFNNEAEINKVQIEPNVMVESGVSFQRAFGTDGNLTYPENSSLYKNINNFVTYLGEMATGTMPSKAATLVSDGLNTSFDQLTMAEQRSGGVAAQVDNARNAMTAFGTQMAASQSALLDTDMAAATASYTRAQTLLNAAQAMFARLQQSNLFSKL